MEIGAEISRKIRGAIKGKLQELGAYVDEELPDYIMVMVANKKSQEQMTEDLSLFLGNNTNRFTVWLHGVLEKLRCVTSEPSSLKSPEEILFESDKNLSGRGDNGSLDEAPAFMISSTLLEKNESWVSTSSHGQRASGVRQSSGDGPSARLMSAVKPLRELSSSEAIIDIKPEPDDLIDDDLSFVQENSLSRKKPIVSTAYGSSRPSLEIYRPPGSTQHLILGTASHSHLHRFPQGTFQSGKPLEAQSSQAFETIHLGSSEGIDGVEENYRTTLKAGAERTSREEESYRKRKLPVVSSVVKISKYCNEGDEEEEEEDDDDIFLRTAGISSSVSVPAKPERRPSLPPSKQANKNLILKAISEAQESITKTTSYATVLQKQTVPVAPRTRLTPEEPYTGLLHMHNHPSLRSSYIQVEDPREPVTERLQGSQQRRDLLSRLQFDPVGSAFVPGQDIHDTESIRHADSRSFIMKKPKLSEEVVSQNQAVQGIAAHSGRLIQNRELLASEKPPSPKFIVTLDGVPSPPGYTSDQEEEGMNFTEEGETSSRQNPVSHKGVKKTHTKQHQILTRELATSDVEMTDVSVPVKQKLPERCRYWPACKHGDECVYHHPTAVCKAFPNCKFAEKCLFIHPNCKYDAKCTRSDCPYTHASRRTPVQAAKPAVPVPLPSSTAQVCRYFPACKKMECPFFHPKHCRFNTQCTRPDCPFYHPTVSVPPRHALKWTRPQTSE
ncbi:zinc finger CCCH domain-containing protein 14 isoform X2 [Microcaecilia unicolor]|uniref:Zinc finger CCCH domain-containing protein 14 n=1 Tax=Microcaecilia unicolor TaxID=1415580 RepID=A0A6P7Z1F3_9AMPH|nr:zinc finger CCCH domain-containing protein 14 isoform X2 [Microcaecilia unicolor]